MTLTDNVASQDQAVLGDAVTAVLPPSRLLAFGEPLHGDDSVLRVRNQLFADLVREAGFRSIAIESCCLRAQVVDRVVTGGSADLDAAMAGGFSHGFGRSAANRELVQQLVEVNRDRPQHDQVRFEGFDPPVEMTHADSPVAAFRLVHDFLRRRLTESRLPCSMAEIEALIGDDDDWTDRRAGRDPGRSIGSAAKVTELRIVADDLRRLMDCELPYLKANSSAAELWDAELGARTSSGLLAYHAAMARDDASRLSRLMGLRAALMAENLLSLAGREADRGPTLVFAHNAHLRKTPSTWRPDGMELRWHPAGSLLSARLGNDYVVVGGAIGSAEHQGIPRPPADSVEGALYKLRPGWTVVPTAAIDLERTTLRPRDDSRNPAYSPLDPDALAMFDAVLFMCDLAPDR